MTFLASSATAQPLCPAPGACVNCDQAVTASSAITNPSCINGLCSRLDCAGNSIQGQHCTTDTGAPGIIACNATPSGSAARCDGMFAMCPGLDSAYCACVASSPIVIDLRNEGFHLTSASDGVRFDLEGNRNDGKKVKGVGRFAWTDPSIGTNRRATRSVSGTSWTSIQF